MMNADMRPGMMGGFGAARIGPAGHGPGAGGSGCGDFSGGCQADGLWKVFVKTGSIGSVAEAGAKDRITYDQEFGWKDAIIPYDYKVEKDKTGRERWTNHGRTLEEISNPNGVGGDRIERFLEAEKEMLADPRKEQAAVFSEDLGYGRNFLYLLSRDKDDNSKINALAIEFQGNESEGFRLMKQLGRKSEDVQKDSNFSLSFNKPLFFTPNNLIRVDDVFNAAQSSYDTEQRKQEMQPFLQRLARDTVGLPGLIEKRQRQEQELVRQVEQEARELLKSKDTQEAFGILGQSMASWASQKDERGDGNIDPLKKEFRDVKQIMEVPIKNYGTSYLIDYRLEDKPRKMRWKPGHGGHGWRRHLRAAEERLAKMQIVPKKVRLTVEDVGEQLLNEFKNKNRHNEKLRETGNIVGKRNIVPELKNTDQTFRLQKKKILIEHNKIFASLKPKEQEVQRGKIFAADKIKGAEDKPRKESIDGRKNKVIWKKTETRAIHREPQRVIDLAKREKRVLKKKEKIHLGSKSQRELRKQIRMEVLVRLRRETGKKIRKEIKRIQTSEKKRVSEIKRLRKKINLIDKISRLVISEQLDKMKDKKLSRNKLLKLAGIIWGKDGSVYKRFKEGKVSKQALRRLRKEVLKLIYI